MTTGEHQVPVLDQENPWPGLAPFDEAQADFFYGRTREVEDLFRRVRLNLLSVLYGQSGLGKTSLVQAALFPRLRGSGHLPVPIRLDYSDGAPSARQQIWHALSLALGQAGTPAAPLAEDQTLWEYFHQRALAKTAVPVLVFDQFEELFTLGPERAGGQSFVRDCVVELAALIENRPPDRVEARFDREPRLVAQYDFDRQDYRLLLSLREDYLAHLHDLAAKIPSIGLNNMRLTPLDGTRALEAVEKPGGRLVAPGAAEAIVRVVAGARDEGRERQTAVLLEGAAPERSAGSEAPLDALVVDPALLSLLCRELNQKRREERLPAITPALVEANRENILNNFYARCLAGLPEGAQLFVEEDLLTESGFRETLTVDTAQTRLRRRGSGPEALTALVNRRLLHYEQRGAVTRVELTHDVLAPVVRQSRALRREREATQEAELRRRRELEESERLAQQARAEAEAKYQRSRRQRRVFAGIGIAMAAVAAVAVYLGVQARARSREASAERDRANQLVKQVEQQNAALLQQQKALSDTTQVATLARDTAHLMLNQAVLARARSESLLKDFCSYGLKVINRFGDSTAGKPELTKAYNSLLELSDASVEQMLDRNPADSCARMLDTRTESISSGVLMDLGDTVSARQRGYRALAAARYLERFKDPQSRQVLAQTYAALAHDFYFARDDSATVTAARRGLPYVHADDQGTDSLAYDREARTYHYGALALLRQNRIPESRQWTDSGLAVTERGRRRADQKKGPLLYTASQIQLVRFDLANHPTVHDTAAALAASRAAVAAARERHTLLHTVASKEWLAKMHGWDADYLRDFQRYAESLIAEDSSVAQWRGILSQGRSDPDTVMIVDGLTGIIRSRRHASWVRTAQKQDELAIGLARAALDSGRVLVQVRATSANLEVLSDAWQTLVNTWYQRGRHLEDAKQLAGADSSYRNAIRIDSLVLEQGSRIEAAISGDLEIFFRGLSRVQSRRLAADTAGKDSTARIALVRQSDEQQRGPRETQVWLRRRDLRRLNTQAGKDSLATALNSLSWTYLLIDRPEQAAEAAKEGLALTTAEGSFLPPNYFNAMLLSGRDEEAATFFRQYAGRMVEDPPVPFPCATLRDTRELARRGIALARHLTVVEGLVAAQQTDCRKVLGTSSP